jgi:hypothetical protein
LSKPKLINSCRAEEEEEEEEEDVFVFNDLRKMGVKNWKQRAQERKRWKEIIEQTKTHKEL